MHPVDFLILLIFLLINVAVGFRIKRKVKDIEDYALGGRNFTTGILTATIVATWLGGNVITSTISKVYNEGIIAMLIMAYNITVPLITALVYIPRMKEFLGKISMGEVMGDLHGTPARIITGVAGIIIGIGIIAIQFKVSATIFSYFFGIPEIWALLISSCIVVAYSTFGGVRAVTFTDVVQFYTFGTFIPILAFRIWIKIGDNNIIYTTLATTPKFHISQLFDISNPEISSKLILILFVSLIPMIGPVLFQRIAMAKDIKQAKESFLLSALFTGMMTALLCWIAILLFSSNPNINTNKILMYIADTYVGVGWKGLIVIGVLALTMSTADSYINSSSVLIFNDIFKPLGIYKNLNSLLTVRVFALIIGILGIIIAFYSDNLMQIFFTVCAYYLPIVNVPFILAIFGFRSKGAPVYIGMAAGFITVLYCQITKCTKLESFIPGMIANFVFFLGSHYLMRAEGGWGKEKASAPAS